MSKHRKSRILAEVAEALSDLKRAGQAPDDHEFDALLAVSSPLSEDIVNRIADLTRGVHADLDEPLDPADE